MSEINSNVASIFGRRIVFFGAAEDVNEPTLLQLFSQHGDVTGLFLVRSALGLPSGCGYVTMGTAEQAAASVLALQGSSECAESGGKLGLLMVQPAAACSSGGHQQDDSGSSTPVSKDSRTVFFTKVPPTVTAHQLIQLFTACGEVLHVELFTPWPGAKISKGCGLVEFARVEAAAAAVNSLHQAFTWPHSHSPLVVEWVDAKRQASNRANKLSKQASLEQTGPIRRALTVPLDREAAMAAGLAGGMYGPSAGAAAYASAPGQLMQQQAQQHHNSRSCPLPRIQGHWVQPMPMPWGSPAGPAAYVHSSVLPQMYQQQQQPGADGYYSVQQQMQQQPSGDAASGSGYWWQPQAQQCSSGMVSGSSSAAQSAYDASSSLAMTTLASTISNSSTMMALSPNDLSANSLACYPACSAGPDVYGEVLNYSNCQSPISSEPSLAIAAAAALGAGRVDPAWQQLQQQNIMLLQPLSNPVEEQQQGPGTRVLLPNTTAGFVAERQSAAMQMAAAAGGSTGMHNVMPASSGSMLLQQQQQYQRQQQQVQQQYQVCYTAAPARQSTAMYQAGSRQMQQPNSSAGHWWVQQQQGQQQQVKGDSMMIVPLSARQLQVMSAVLPEVPRLTGANACLAAGTVGGAVQLMLTGQASEVQSAHSVVAMLLSKMGVDEPLVSAMHQQAPR